MRPQNLPQMDADRRGFEYIESENTEVIKGERLLRSFNSSAAFGWSRKSWSIYLAVYFATYFAAAAGFLALAAGLAEDLATTGTIVVRRRRFLSRFLAVARLRVFSRALSFGMVVLLGFGLQHLT
jgi:hypothetical protein